MIREIIDYVIIKRSGYFDPAYYLLRYPDCRLADVDPLWHFVRYGWREGRNPSQEFDTTYYFQHNPDVKAAGVNPLVHYIRFGRQEGRFPKPSQGITHQAGFSSRRMNRLQKIIYTIGLKVYWIIPAKYRQQILQWLYARLGFLFRGMPDYERWLVTSRFSGRISYATSNLVDLSTVEPAREPKGEIAIHLHVFYPDLAGELAEHLKNMPFPYDLYVSVATEQALEICRQLFADLPLCRKVDIRVVPNRGRDLAPMFCTFGAELSQYDYIAHLHTKKSLHNKGATEGWREYLYRNLLGSKNQIRKIFTLMQEFPPYGIVYPQPYHLVPSWGNTWLANRELGRTWCLRLGINDIPRGYFDYPVGSMFWARGDALSPLFNAGIRLSDFPEESGQTDGTLAHTLERLFVLCSLKQGMRPAIIKDTVHPSWSAWRFDHYVNRPYQAMVAALNVPHIKLIAFDIFDTLLSRPLLDPESIKDIVARRVGGAAGTLYKQYRAMAEDLARKDKGRDVGMDEIYAYLQRLTGLSERCLKELRNTEEEVEEAILKPRWEILRLYEEALNTGKTVILVSDMFLDPNIIERFLRKFGIGGWKEVFVSSGIGLRKDTGELYSYILAKYGLRPSHMIVIGDDERSDAQIPTSMGISSPHILKPVEMARGLPRFSKLISIHERSRDLDAQITLGLVVYKNFAPITYPDFDPASLVQVTPYNWGYSLVGPLLVSFAQWLLEKAQEDGIQRLYFLAREGRLMKEVYDQWSQKIPGAPKSIYLVVSRRAAGVAAISTFEDIVEIAQTHYFPNRLEHFLRVRYGITLEDEHWERIERATGWRRDSTVKIWNRKVEHLIPLLQLLQPEIIQRAEKERQAFRQYLEKEGLCQNEHQAVVDIGYGGSVQGYLNRILSQRVHGYYLMTDERAARISQTYGVILRGCLCENVPQSTSAPVFYIYSFEIEKLLCAPEPQIECYEIENTCGLKPRYYNLSEAEADSSKIKEEIRQGALDYVRDACQIREKILPDFRPSCWTSQMLLEAFLTERSDKELNLLSKIVLDDHYCGRGLVS
jgi:predicted HAD superfamily hydrolase